MPKGLLDAYRETQRGPVVVGADEVRVMAQLKVTQVKSAIGPEAEAPRHAPRARPRGIGQSNTLPDRPEIRGMIARVPHLVTVEAVRKQ